MPWLRLDADIFDNPKMIDLPMGAQCLFLRICCVMKSSSERVSLSASYWSPRYWARRTNERQSDCEMWLENLQAAGLIENDGERLMIHNWREYQPDPTAAERKAEERERKKGVTDVTVTTVSHECHADLQDIRDIQDRPNNTDKDSTTTEESNSRARALDFESFWAAYPAKTGKKAAAKAWKAATGKPPIAVILQAVEAQKGGDRWQNGFVKNPSTWLNQGCWDDVPIPPRIPETDGQRAQRLQIERLTREIAEEEAKNGNDVGDKAADENTEHGVHDIQGEF